MKIQSSKIIFITFLFCTVFSQYSGSMKTAKMYEMQKNWDAAISIYKDVLNKNPNNYQIIRSLKTLYKKSQRYKEGINFLIYQISRNPNDIQLNVELGELYFLDDNIEEAKRVWKEGLSTFKNNKSYYRLLFSTYNKHSLDKELFRMVESGRLFFNDSFLSTELGNYHQKRKQYKNALDEYLLSLLNNPGASSSISRKILIMSDDIESKNMIEMKLLENSLKNPNKILPILSDHYFKHREFKKSYETLLELSEKEKFNPKKWLGFSNSLRKEKAYSHAIKSYQYLLKKDLKDYQYGEGLLGLAKTFEDQIFPLEKNDLIPYFYNDNIFFKDATQLSTNISSKNLVSSLSIYDSVLITIPESAIIAEAEFRLAEIQYRIIEDFDKALLLYKSSLSKSNSKILKEKNILRIADVFKSKADFNSSIKFLDSTYSIHVTPEIKNKLIEMHLFSGDPDTSLFLINELFKTVMADNAYFNDLMELRDFINHFYINADEKSKEGFIGFLKSESLLKQRKVFEANQLLSHINKNNNNETISPLLSLRRAIILTRLKKYNEALSELNLLEDTIFADKGIIMSGQIHERFYNDPSKASEFYLRIINDYSDSIFSEPIRYHLRKLKDNEKI
tara:strand:+ start:4134 stop:5993 length:1860 start_codon:yes stop_codon:yes gene_type:complete